MCWFICISCNIEVRLSILNIKYFLFWNSVNIQKTYFQKIFILFSIMSLLTYIHTYQFGRVPFFSFLANTFCLLSAWYSFSYHSNVILHYGFDFKFTDERRLQTFLHLTIGHWDVFFWEFYSRYILHFKIRLFFMFICLALEILDFLVHSIE